MNYVWSLRNGQWHIVLCGRVETVYKPCKSGFVLISTLGLLTRICQYISDESWQDKPYISYHWSQDANFKFADLKKKKVIVIDDVDEYGEDSSLSESEGEVPSVS